MIFKEILPGNQMKCLRWSCTTPTEVIELKTIETKDFCLCDYSTICPYSELAFTDILDKSNKYKNDYRKFLINPKTETSTWSFILIDKNNVEHVIYSDTEESELFGDVSIQGSNSKRPLQVGVNVKWVEVAVNLGYGDYTVKVSVTDLGNEDSYTTHNFRVVPFNTQRANNTIKIEVNNVGLTMNGEDFTGLFKEVNTAFIPYTNMLRVHGRLTLTDPDIEIESIQDAQRETRPVQTSLTDTYKIAVERVPFALGRVLVHESIVMNWSVTDYNVFNEDQRDVEMIVQSSSVEDTPEFTKKTYELTAKSNTSKLNRKFI